MRLVCPNCDAEYEVDDSAVPRAGRDVQCSNCGHAWFQAHPEVEAEQEAEEALYEPPVAAAAPAPPPTQVSDIAVDLPPLTEPAHEVAAFDAAEQEFEDEPAPVLSPEQAVAATLSASAAASVPVPTLPSRALDESVLAVLREEAARETAARKSDAPPPGLETQTEMGLDAETGTPPAGGLAAAAVRRIARLKGGTDPEPPPVPKSRREMLPAIEEINSTLRATSDRHSDEDNAIYDTMPDLNTKRRSGFGRGFLTLVVVAVLVVALYLAAPMIGQRFPALAAPAQAYVTSVDAVRVWVDTEIKALIATLRGYDGGQAG